MTLRPDIGQGQYVETVLTCKGDFYDPDFPRQLELFNHKLNLLLQTEQDEVVIKKVEPWNSVKVTLDIPKNAAARLKILASQDENALRSVGILSIQMDGDKIISLTLAGKDSTPVEICAASTNTLTSTSEPSTSQKSAMASAHDSTLLSNLFRESLAKVAAVNKESEAPPNTMAPPRDLLQNRSLPQQASGRATKPSTKRSSTKTPRQRKTGSRTEKSSPDKASPSESTSVASMTMAQVVPPDPHRDLSPRIPVHEHLHLVAPALVSTSSNIEHSSTGATQPVQQSHNLNDNDRLKDQHPSGSNDNTEQNSGLQPFVKVPPSHPTVPDDVSFASLLQDENHQLIAELPQHSAYLPSAQQPHSSDETILTSVTVKSSSPIIPSPTGQTEQPMDAISSPVKHMELGTSLTEPLHENSGPTLHSPKTIESTTNIVPTPENTSAKSADHSEEAMDISVLEPTVSAAADSTHQSVDSLHQSVEPMDCSSSIIPDGDQLSPTPLSVPSDQAEKERTVESSLSNGPVNNEIDNDSSNVNISTKHTELVETTPELEMPTAIGAHQSEQSSINEHKGEDFVEEAPNSSHGVVVRNESVILSNYANRTETVLEPCDSTTRLSNTVPQSRQSVITQGSTHTSNDGTVNGKQATSDAPASPGAGTDVIIEEIAQPKNELCASRPVSVITLRNGLSSTQSTQQDSSTAMQSYQSNAVDQTPQVLTSPVNQSPPSVSQQEPICKNIETSSMQQPSMNASNDDVNASIEDMNASIDDVNASIDDVNASIDDVNASIDDVANCIQSPQTVDKAPLDLATHDDKSHSHVEEIQPEEIASPMPAQCETSIAPILMEASVTMESVAEHMDLEVTTPIESIQQSTEHCDTLQMATSNECDDMEVPLQETLVPEEANVMSPIPNDVEPTPHTPERMSGDTSAHPPATTEEVDSVTDTETLMDDSVALQSGPRSAEELSEPGTSQPVPTPTVDTHVSTSVAEEFSKPTMRSTENVVMPMPPAVVDEDNTCNSHISESLEQNNVLTGSDAFLPVATTPTEGLPPSLTVQTSVPLLTPDEDPASQYAHELQTSGADTLLPVEPSPDTYGLQPPEVCIKPDEPAPIPAPQVDILPAEPSVVVDIPDHEPGENGSSTSTDSGVVAGSPKSDFCSTPPSGDDHQQHLPKPEDAVAVQRPEPDGGLTVMIQPHTNSNERYQRTTIQQIQPPSAEVDASQQTKSRPCVSILKKQALPSNQVTHSPSIQTVSISGGEVLTHNSPVRVMNRGNRSDDMPMTAPVTSSHAPTKYVVVPHKRPVEGNYHQGILLTTGKGQNGPTHPALHMQSGREKYVIINNIHRDRPGGQPVVINSTGQAAGRSNTHMKAQVITSQEGRIPKSVSPIHQQYMLSTSQPNKIRTLNSESITTMRIQSSNSQGQEPKNLRRTITTDKFILGSSPRNSVSQKRHTLTVTNLPSVPPSTSADQTVTSKQLTINTLSAPSTVVTTSQLLKQPEKQPDNQPEEPNGDEPKLKGNTQQFVPPPPETAVSEPAVSEPAVSEPAVSEPAVSEPAVFEPAVESQDNNTQQSSDEKAEHQPDNGSFGVNGMSGDYVSSPSLPTPPVEPADVGHPTMETEPVTTAKSVVAETVPVTPSARRSGRGRIPKQPHTPEAYVVKARKRGAKKPVEDENHIEEHVEEGVSEISEVTPSKAKVPRGRNKKSAAPTPVQEVEQTNGPINVPTKRATRSQGTTDMQSLPTVYRERNKRTKKS